MRSRILAPIVLALVALAAAPARAAGGASDPMRLEAVVGLGGLKTEWRGDAGAHSILRLGLRPNDYFSVYFQGRLGYGAVDERMLTLVSLGAQLWPLGQGEHVSPFLRLSIAHQHEETLFVVKDDPLGALFGIGDGIRHRGGFEGALGADLPVYSADGLQAFASFDASVIWFYDPRGPTWYAGANAGVGLSYDL